MGLWSNGIPVKPLEVRPHSLNTGVNFIADEGKILIYPNPGNGIFNFEIERIWEKQNCGIEVYDVLGKKIYSKMSINNFPFSIDLSGKTKGIYLYRLFTENGKLMVNGKLVIR